MTSEKKRGFVPVDRNVIYDPIITKPALFHLFMYLLIKANHSDVVDLQNGVRTKIRRGTTKTGINLLSDQLEIPKSTLHKRLKLLEQFGYIKIHPYNHFSIIFIVNYDKITCLEDISSYQNKLNGDSIEIESDTINNDNNEKNVKKKN